LTDHGTTRSWLSQFLPPEPPAPPPASNDPRPVDRDLDRRLVEAELDAELAIDRLNQIAETLPPAAALALLRQIGVRTTSVQALRQALDSRRRLAYRGTLPVNDDTPKRILDDALPALDRLSELVGKDNLRLLTADDNDLLVEATEIASRRQARHAAAIAAGKEGLHPRERDARSIRRWLRRQVNQSAAHLAGILGLIGGRQSARLPAYVDDWALKRWQQVQEAGRAFVESRVLVAANGETVPLKDAVEGATKAREARWYAVLLGLQQVAQRRGLAPVFLTLTLPAEYHLHATNGQRGNPRNSPTVAAKEINARWHNLLSVVHQRGTTPIGVRVIEPHTDGCPHLHCCLWLAQDGIRDLTDALDIHFPATTPEEAAARRRGDYTQGPAALVKSWRPGEAASPVSYVLTYVLKTLRSEKAPDDNEPNGGHDRAAAWASMVGVRRLDLIGLKRGLQGRWQAMQRTIRAAGDDRLPEPRARAIAHAMKRRQWGTALVLLGAFADAPRLAAVRAERRNCWGDAVQVTTDYAHPLTGEIVATVRPREWKIQEIRKAEPAGQQATAWTEESLNKVLEDYGLSKVFSYPSGGAGAPPPGSAGPPPIRRRPTMLQIDAANDDQLPETDAAA